MNKEKIDAKFGSEDMAFWKQIVDARKMDIEASKRNIKYFGAILEVAEQKYKEAEEAFKKDGKK